MDQDAKLLTEAYLNKIVGEGLFKKKPKYMATFPGDSKTDKRLFNTKEEAEAYAEKKRATGIHVAVRKISDLVANESAEPQSLIGKGLVSQAEKATSMLIDSIKQRVAPLVSDDYLAGEGTVIKRAIGEMMIEKIYKDLMGIHIDPDIGYKLKSDESPDNGPTGLRGDPG